MAVHINVLFYSTLYRQFYPCYKAPYFSQRCFITKHKRYKSSIFEGSRNVKCLSLKLTNSRKQVNDIFRHILLYPFTDGMTEISKLSNTDIFYLRYSLLRSTKVKVKTESMLVQLDTCISIRVLELLKILLSFISVTF